MPATTNRLDGSAFREPRNLWEAMGALAQIREQQSFAARAEDRAQVERLRSLQSVTWAYIKTFAAQLVERGEAPPDMVERLRNSLEIHPARERELSTARQHLASRARLSPDADRLAA